MKKKLTLLLISFTHFILPNNNLEITISGAQSRQMPLAIMILDDKNKELQDISAIMKKDLQFTDQFTVTTHSIPAAMPKKELLRSIKKLCSDGTPLALCLNKGNKNRIEWRLYDTMNGSLIAGKEYKKQGSVVRGWAHALADIAFSTLTGNKGFFCSRITYCKEVTLPTGKKARNIYVADFDGSNPELLVESTTITAAPRWNVDQKNPRIFYSEHTDTNVRLMSVDMNKNQKIASNFDGVNMLAGFSPDGKAAAYCASNGNGNCQLYYHTKGSLKSFTRNNGNNFAPFFIDNDRVGFCSDAQTGSPQIYIGNLNTGHVERITTGGYCTSPSYCPTNNTIAYNKKVNNIMQIQLYDCATKKHKQVTQGDKNKHEASWSPDGTHLLFGQEHAGKSQILSLNLITKKINPITRIQDKCSYPHWSPHYKHFPTIT